MPLSALRAVCPASPYEFDIPIPRASTARNPDCDVIRDMPVGASIFMHITYSKASSYVKTCSKEGKKYAMRKLLKDGKEGMRIWRIS